MVVTITRDGFIKRTPLETFREQNRGGRGRRPPARAATTSSPAASTPTRISGCCSSPRAARPTGRRCGSCRRRARPRRAARWSTCCPSSGPDEITTVLPLPQDETLWENLHLVFATAQGNVRRNRLSDFRNVRASGLIAMKLDEGDRPDRRRHLPRGRRRVPGDPHGPLHPLPDHRRHAARVRRPRQFRRARHPARDGKKEPTRSSASPCCAMSMPTTPSAWPT